MKRLFCFFLSFAILFALLPVPAMAAENAEPEMLPQEQLPVAPVEEEPKQTEASETEAAVEENAAAASGPDGWIVEDVDTQWEPLLVNGVEISNEDLFAGYVDRAFYGEEKSDPLSFGNQSAGARLTGDEAKAYKALVPVIKKIASGSRASTVVELSPVSPDAAMTFTERYYEFDYNGVLHALRMDYPYEMYWCYHYRAAWSYSPSTGQLYSFTYKFIVDKKIQGSNDNLINTTKAKATTTAAANAKAIVSKYAGKDDYTKLCGFRDEICALVEYDTYAAENDIAAWDYGPWQIVYTFDGDPSTNVVCGGYAKSFQYLCDVAGITCYYVLGYVDGGYHAWNIVTLQNKNYHVDATWIDGGWDNLFLAGTVGTPNTGYVFRHPYGSTAQYVYEDTMFDTWGNGVLTLASSDYVPCSHSFTSKVTKAATCTATGIRHYSCSKCGYGYDETIAKAAHKYSKKVTAPTCTAQGYTTYTCSVCKNTYKSDYTQMKEHDWKIKSSEDADCRHYATVTYSCGSCKKTYTEEIRSGWSSWSSSYPSGIDASRIQSKQQYRYRDSGSGWVTTENGSIDYVKSWPGGFYTGSSLYAQYNKTPKNPSLTETTRVTIHSDAVIGYLYWHWCRGSYSGGPIDRYISNGYTDTYPAFHAYFSTQTTTIMDSATRQAYQMPNADCCRDSFWYYRLPVYRQSYTVEQLYASETPGVWSDWSDTVYTASAIRQVESRTVYRYNANGYGEHKFDAGTVLREPSGAVAGVKKYTCTVCGTIENRDFHYSEDVYRLAGSGRSETARKAAAALKQELGTAKFTAIVYTSGSQFADALAGSYFAVQKKAPILLYTAGGASANLQYIKENLTGSGIVYILGGTAAVPGSVETALMQQGIRVQRIYGNNRYETNIQILKAAGFAGGEILVCTGQDYADSLSASAVGLPILLVKKDWTQLSSSCQQYLQSLPGTCSFHIIGGTGAVGDGVAKALRSYGSVDRIYGDTRAETSVAVAKRFFGTPDSLVLAYSQNFPDGLCGGPLANVMGAPLILTKDGRAAAADAYADAYGITSGAVLGGESLISDKTAKEIFNMGKNLEIPKK